MADIRYQKLKNGQLLCTAGVNGSGGVLTTILTWVKRERRPDDGPDDEPDRGNIIESHWLRAGGIDGATDDHVVWCDEPLESGDEIVIHILGPGAADEPKERHK
jgi:hypothetical protein